MSGVVHKKAAEWGHQLLATLFYVVFFLKRDKYETTIAYLGVNSYLLGMIHSLISDQNVPLGQHILHRYFF